MVDVKYYISLSLKDRQAYLRSIAKNRINNKIKNDLELKLNIKSELLFYNII